MVLTARPSLSCSPISLLQSSGRPWNVRSQIPLKPCTSCILPGVMSSIVSPQKTDILVLNPSTCGCDLNWKQGLYRCHQVKMGSCCSLWVLVQYDRCPYNKREIWTQTHREGWPREDGSGVWSDETTSQRMPGTPRRWKRQEGFFSRTFGGRQPWDTWILGFRPPDSVRGHL